MSEMVVGSTERPYQLVIPQWMAREIEEREGRSAQEFADEFFPVAVEIIVVGSL